MPIKHSFLFILLSLSYLTAFSQVQLSSPVSTLGFGKLADRDFAFVQAVGGTRASFHSPDQLNLGNPASLAHLRTTVFSGGIFAERTNISDRGNDSKVWTGNVGYFSLGMPLQNEINALFDRQERKVKWGLNISLQPYNITGYDFQSSQGLTNGDTINRSYEGDGSTYIVSISNGWKYKNASVGLTLGHLFGATMFEQAAAFPLDHAGSGYSFTTVESSKINYRAFVWNLGFMYDVVFGRTERADGTLGAPNKYLTLGLTFQSERPLKTETDRSIIRQNQRIRSVIGIDTLSVTNDVEGEGTLPSTINFGASYIYKKLWRAGVNYERSAWSNFRNGEQSQTQDTKNAFRLSGGFAFTPNASSITSYFDRVTYSVSGFYEKDPRVLKGNQLTNYGARVGFMLPFVGQRQVSYLNLNIGYGRLGVSGGYTENYLTFGLGYSLTDNQWFIKRKYD